MRKMFNTLKSLIATAVMVSMLGTASLATSCVDEYDDTDIKGQISQVQKDLKALTERVANLENKLNNEVSALKSMINDLNVVVSAEQVGGNWEITLSDGTEFTVYGPCDIEDTDTDTDCDTYLVPKKDTDGVYYWAVVYDNLGDEIVEEWLLVDGAKVPVFGGAECDCEPQEPQEGCDCVAPELKFDVDENGNLLVSIDGGKTWVESGINANNFCNCDPNAGGNTEGGNCIFSGVDTTTKPGYAIFTLVDGSIVEVMMGQLINFSVKGKAYIQPKETKEIAFTVSSNVESVEVMNAPMGWRAAIKEDVLVVTAPSRELVVAGAADQEGFITFHLNTTSGQCKIAKMEVAYAELTLTVKGENITITNSIVVETNYGWGPQFNFNSFMIGFAPIDTFKANPTEYIENIYDNYDDVYYYGDNLFDGWYEEGVCEVMEINTTIAEAYYYGSWEELPAENFAIWVCPMDASGRDLVVEGLSYHYYYVPTLKAEQTAASFADVDIAVDLKGFDSYEVVFDRAQNWMEQDGFNPVEAALSEWVAYKDMYAQYGMDYFFGYGNQIVGDFEYEGSYAELQADVYQAYSVDLLKPSTEYVFVVLPITNGRALTDYTVDDVKIFTFKTADIVAGGESTITVTPTEIGYTSLKASIEYSEDVVVAYWNYFKKGSEEAVTTGGETLAKFMLDKGNMSTEFPTNATKTYGLAMGEEWDLVVMALDAEGNYTLKVEPLKTAEMSYNDAVITIEEITPLNNSFSVKLACSATDVVKYRVLPTATYNLDWNGRDYYKNQMLTNSDEYYTYSTVTLATGKVTGKAGSWDAANNTLTVTGSIYNNTEYTVFVVAQLTDGSWTETMVEAVVTPAQSLDPFFASESEEAQAIYTALGTPMIYDFSIDPSMPNWLDFSIKFETIADGMKVYVWNGEEEVLASQGGAREKGRAAYIVENGTELTKDDNSVMTWMNHNGKDLYYTVKDAEGNWYGVFMFDLGQVYDAMVGGGAAGGMDPLSK